MGEVHAAVAFGTQIVGEDATFETHYAPGGSLWSEARGTTPTVLELLSRTHFQQAEEPYGEELVDAFPLEETVPGKQDVSIEGLTLRHRLGAQAER